MGCSMDWEKYEESVDVDGYDPLREDTFEDNLLTLYVRCMMPAQYEAFVSLLDAENITETSDMVRAAATVTGYPVPTAQDLFDAVINGGFMDPVDLYRLIWHH